MKIKSIQLKSKDRNIFSKRFQEYDNVFVHGKEILILIVDKISSKIKVRAEKN